MQSIFQGQLILLLILDFQLLLVKEKRSQIYKSGFGKFSDDA